MKPTGNEKAKGKIRVLKLQRETLRELDAGELKQAQGGQRTYYCNTADYHCTRTCPKTVGCAYSLDKHCTRGCG
jgi:hypothetical protein